MEEKEGKKKLNAKDFFKKLQAMEEIPELFFELQMTNKFKKSIDLAYRRNLDLTLLFEVIEKLAKNEELEEKYCRHQLKGQYAGVCECHVKPDWLLLWTEDADKLILLLLNTATHSDFMDKKRNKPNS